MQCVYNTLLVLALIIIASSLLDEVVASVVIELSSRSKFSSNIAHHLIQELYPSILKIVGNGIGKFSPNIIECSLQANMEPFISTNQLSALSFAFIYYFCKDPKNLMIEFSTGSRRFIESMNYTIKDGEHGLIIISSPSAEVCPKWSHQFDFVNQLIRNGSYAIFQNTNQDLVLSTSNEKTSIVIYNRHDAGRRQLINSDQVLGFLRSNLNEEMYDIRVVDAIVGISAVDRFNDGWLSFSCWDLHFVISTAHNSIYLLSTSKELEKNKAGQVIYTNITFISDDNLESDFRLESIPNEVIRLIKSKRMST